MNFIYSLSTPYLLVIIFCLIIMLVQIIRLDRAAKKEKRLIKENLELCEQLIPYLISDMKKELKDFPFDIPGLTQDSKPKTKKKTHVRKSK